MGDVQQNPAHVEKRRPDRRRLMGAVAAFTRRRLFRPMAALFVVELLALAAGAGWVLLHRAPVVLLYHEVAPLPAHVLGITPEVFEGHLAWLRDHGYRVVPLEEVVAGLEGGRGAPADAVAITFDDSLGSTAACVAPLLRRYEAPATFFLCSGDVGYAGRLAWEDVRALERAGIAVGGHSRTHPWLPDLSDGEMAREIGDDRRALREEGGARAEFFAYPFGAVDARVARAARAAGYRAAFAVTPGARAGADGLFALRRAAVGPWSSRAPVFRLLVSGYWPALKEGACAVLGVESPRRHGEGLGWGAWGRIGAIACAGLASAGWAVGSLWRRARRGRGGRIALTWLSGCR